jgi:hypothetical protein
MHAPRIKRDVHLRSGPGRIFCGRKQTGQSAWVGLDSREAPSHTCNECFSRKLASGCETLRPLRASKRQAGDDGHSVF